MISLKLFKKKEDVSEECGNCYFYDEEKKMCTKLWAPVASNAKACRMFRKKDF